MDDLAPAERLLLRDLAGREDGARVIAPGSVLGQLAGPLVDRGLLAIGGRTWDDAGVWVRITDAGRDALRDSARTMEVA